MAENKVKFKHLWIYILIASSCFLQACVKDGKANNETAPIPTTIETPAEAETVTPVEVYIPDYLRVQTWYTSQIGVVEATGKNDGVEVEFYLAKCGLGKGYAWCACFVKAGFDVCGVHTSITAWSPSAHNPKNLVYFKKDFTLEPRPGDVVCFWYTTHNRIAHTGFYDKRINESFYESIEGNTSSGSYAREGEGVYKKKRSFNATYSISRWTKDK